MHGRLDQPALETRGLGVRYGSTVALEDVSVRVHPGEVVALVGPNGAGKSSFLRAVLSLVPYTGEVVVHTDRKQTRGVAFVPQRADVDLHFPLTVNQLVADGRRPFCPSWKRLTTADRLAVREAIETVGLDGLERRPLDQLSGGQLQRALIARALAQEATLLLLDEPLSGVDAPTGAALIALLHELGRQDRAVVVSTHDLAQVRRHFERCVVLNRRKVSDGPPRDSLTPQALEQVFFSRA